MAYDDVRPISSSRRQKQHEKNRNPGWTRRALCHGLSRPTYLPASFGHDRDLHVLRQTQDLRGDAAISQELPATALWAHQKNLGDSLTARKIYNCCRGRFSL